MHHFPQTLAYYPVCSKSVYVSNIINDGQWRIPDFVRDLIPDICNTVDRVPLGNGDDTGVWTISLDGEYQMKSTYKKIRKKKPLFEWYNTVWSANWVPKFSFIT